MTESPCEFSITSEINGTPADCVTLEFRDGPQLLFRAIISPADFWAAISLNRVVTAAISTGRAQ